MASKKFDKQMPSINPEDIVQIGPHSFLVPYRTTPDTSYLVDMGMRHCGGSVTMTEIFKGYCSSI